MNLPFLDSLLLIFVLGNSWTRSGKIGIKKMNLLLIGFLRVLEEVNKKNREENEFIFYWSSITFHEFLKKWIRKWGKIKGEKKMNLHFRLVTVDLRSWKLVNKINWQEQEKNEQDSWSGKIGIKKMNPLLIFDHFPRILKEVNKKNREENESFIDLRSLSMSSWRNE